MPGRTKDEAWRNFRDPIRRVVICLNLEARTTERQLTHEIRRIAAPVSGIPFGPALSLNFGIDLEWLFEDGLWRMTTVKYDYTLVRTTQPDQVIFGWHWHPRSKRSSVTYPHLHVPAALEFPTKHIPTGRVALEDVVVFGFRELKIQPAHETAEAVVAEVMGKHKAHRSWA